MLFRGPSTRVCLRGASLASTFGGRGAPRFRGATKEILKAAVVSSEARGERSRLSLMRRRDGAAPVKGNV